MKKCVFLTVGIIISIFQCDAQTFGFSIQNSIKVLKNKKHMSSPWAGGLNSPQFSKIDVNMDGVKDLFVFDRTDNKILTFINTGTKDSTNYQWTSEYTSKLPTLDSWALCADYNCDGKNDIFTRAVGGIRVYKNTSNIESGLSFELENQLLDAWVVNNSNNIPTYSIDIPAIVDIDGDNDLDILTYGISSTFIQYYKNLSMEKYKNCDSLNFELANFCWGLFSESISTNELNLLDTIDCQNNLISPKNKQHIGSTILALDLNDNHVMDLIIGDVSFNNLIGLINGGDKPNTNSHIISQDPSFPRNSKPVNLSIFPAAFHLDVNNDGKRDLLVSPNAKNVSENAKSVWYYKNIGTDSNPIFDFQQDDFLQDQMIELGYSAYPVLFDYNNDSLTDLVISSYGYFNQSNNSYQSKISLYKNIGTSSTPIFEFITDDFASISSLNLTNALYPSFGDLDSDGDKDMLLGDIDGYLHYFENTASSGDTSIFELSEEEYKDKDGSIIDDGKHATPFIVDMNRDGLLDLVIGERNGNINYYQNTGTTNNPEFEKMTENFGGVNTTEPHDIIGLSNPHIVNINGTYQLFSGSESGYIYHYNNIDDNLEGKFTLVDSMLSSIHIGLETSVALGDIDSDGQLEMFVGNHRGGVSFYEFDSTKLTSTNTIERTRSNITLYPNPANKEINILLDNKFHQTIEKLAISIYDVTGKTILQLNTSSNSIVINTSDLSDGIYFILGSNEHLFFSKKFIIKQ